METSIASSPSIGKEEVFNPTYESNVHFDWGLEGCAMEMEVDKEEGVMDNVVSEPRSQQQEKVEVYRKWGLTEDEIFATFKRQPWFMTKSEDKINGVMDFLVNKMGWESSLVARIPIIISLSLEKRIVPRCAVYQALLLKGLIKTNKISLATFLNMSETKLVKKILSYDKEEGPELLSLYKEKMDLAK
ncbi:hypothetical protein RHGRI_005590 [Rhododendron griersonianum]|uniref:Uncharacterized protein n=1 Tax=Rhododendron griersonianum TaxID=479676 RepID=A0AAV6LFD5_9ERIC|nr:hypothetical protein RHGRI_005590 [Rhododendron griersonianum]